MTLPPTGDGQPDDGQEDWVELARTKGDGVLVPWVLVRALGGDYLAAAALKRIIWWWGLKTKDGRRYGVDRDGEHWIALSWLDLADDLGISEGKARRVLRHLAEAGFLVKGGPWQFNGRPTIHYRPEPDAFRDAYCPPTDDDADVIPFRGKRRNVPSKSAEPTVEKRDSYTEESSEESSEESLGRVGAAATQAPQAAPPPNGIASQRTTATKEEVDRFVVALHDEFVEMHRDRPGYEGYAAVFDDENRVPQLDRERALSRAAQALLAIGPVDLAEGVVRVGPPDWDVDDAPPNPTMPALHNLRGTVWSLIDFRLMRMGYGVNRATR